MRREKANLIQRVLLSPSASVVISLVAAAWLIVGQNQWLGTLFSVALGIFGAYQIKARTLFKGANFPFAALFLALQAATRPTLLGNIFGATAFTALIVAMLLFQQRQQTRVIFLIMLVCGFGALGARCFLLLSPALTIALAIMGAFSLRGLVASVLGLLTPLVIAVGFGLYNPLNLLEIYSSPWLDTLDYPMLIAAIPALLFALVMFLPAYGYPQKQRMCNMAILSMTLSATAMAIVDPVHADDYIVLINLCSAYWATHLAATRRHGWLAIIATLGFCIYYAYTY